MSENLQGALPEGSLPAGQTTPQPRGRMSALQKREALTGWLFLTPSTIAFLIFTIFAVAVAFWLGFQEWDLLSPPKFVGLENYRKALTGDPNFRRTLYNTFYFAVGLVPLIVATSLGLAVAVNRQLKGISFFRAALYMPTVTSTVAISIVWIWLYNPSFGLINWLWGSLGVANPPHWLENTLWAKPAMIAMTVWQECGYYMIIFLAGLQTIPDHLYEAADMDGASGWQKFWRITLPLLSPTTFLVTVMKTIYSFQIFEQVYVMTMGKPAGTTETIVYFIYMNGFQWFKMGYAAAAAWVLFVIIFSLTLIQFRFQKNWVHYE